jgi:hypothetical protein
VKLLGGFLNRGLFVNGLDRAQVLSTLADDVYGPAGHRVARPQNMWRSRNGHEKKPLGRNPTVCSA